MDILDLFGMIYGFSIIALMGVAIVQFISRRREIARIRESVKCTNCGHDDLEIELSVVNMKSKRKVSLLKNIGGSLIWFALAFAFFRWFAIVVTDLIVGSNTTGVQDESGIMQIGLWSFFLILGIGFAIQGIQLIDAYFGEKMKFIILTCNVCKSVYTVDRTYNHQAGAKDDLHQVMTSLIPIRLTPLAGTKPKEIAASPSMVKENLEPCKNCRNLIETSDLTCPHCGHTQWGVIGFMAVLAIFIVGFVVIRAIGGSGSGLIFWGGVILGTLLLMATVYSIVKAIQGPSSDSPDPEPETDERIQQAELDPENSSALPKMQGILVISRRPMDQATIVNLTQQILDAQKSKGYAVATGFEATHVVAGNDVDNDMFAYAKLRDSFSKFGNAEIVKRAKVFPFEFPDGAAGKFYVLYDRPHS